MAKTYKSKAPKKIPTPEAFLECFERYRKKVKEDPFLVDDYVGKDGKNIDRKKEKPLSMEGFENFLEDEYGIGQVQQYLENRGGRYEEFVSIVKRVKRVIREDQVSGGMVGVYNPNLTARINGINETIDTKGDNVKILNYDPL